MLGDNGRILAPPASVVTDRFPEKSTGPTGQTDPEGRSLAAKMRAVILAGLAGHRRTSTLAKRCCRGSGPAGSLWRRRVLPDGNRVAVLVRFHDPGLQPWVTAPRLAAEGGRDQLKTSVDWFLGVRNPAKTGHDRFRYVVAIRAAGRTTKGKPRKTLPLR